MKYSHKLTINGVPTELIKHDVRLRYSQPGTASFTVKSTATLSGVVLFSLAVNGQQPHNQFYGYIERCTPASAEHQILFCREKSAALKPRLPISQRNKSLRDLLSEIAGKTGLKFSLPPQSYADTPVPYFINTGSGYHAMQQIGEVWQIPDYIWQLKRDGSIFVGSWSDSHWPGKPITIPANLLDKQQASQTAQMLAIPGLRPGFVLNGHRLTSVDLADNKMVIQWGH